MLATSGGSESLTPQHYEQLGRRKPTKTSVPYPPYPGPGLTCPSMSPESHIKLAKSKSWPTASGCCWRNRLDPAFPYSSSGDGSVAPFGVPFSPVLRLGPGAAFFLVPKNGDGDCHHLHSRFRRSQCEQRGRCSSHLTFLRLGTLQTHRVRATAKEGNLPACHTSIPGPGWSPWRWVIAPAALVGSCGLSVGFIHRDTLGCCRFRWGFGNPFLGLSSP